MCITLAKYITQHESCIMCFIKVKVMSDSPSSNSNAACGILDRMSLSGEYMVYYIVIFGKL